MFEGFDLAYRDARQQKLRLRHAGKAPPVLMLHGNPQTHAMWHRVAPALVGNFTVICPDLTGYGLSSKPSRSADHAAYAKRAMAADMHALMEGFGYQRYQIVAHDRGARVAHRMALDFPDSIERLCVMDIVPTLHHFEHANMDFALGYYHWFLLAQPHPIPERLITRDVLDWFRLHTSRDPGQRYFFHLQALADYIGALKAAGTVEAICEDYRAAASIDLVHDRASRAAGQRLSCPLLVLWGAKGKIGQWYAPLDVWRDYASGPVTGGAVKSGHYLAEEAPEEVLAALERFLNRKAG